MNGSSQIGGYVTTPECVRGGGGVFEEVYFESTERLF